MLGDKAFESYLRERRRSSPPHLSATICLIFACRAFAGILFRYGARPVTWIAFASAALYFVLAAVRFFERSGFVRRYFKFALASELFFRRFGTSLPISALAVVSVFDYASTGGESLFVWPALIVAAVFLNPFVRPFVVSGAVSFAAGAVVLAMPFGVSAASERMFTLAASVAVALGVFFSRRAEYSREYREHAERTEKERVLSTLRDAEVEIAARIQRSLLLDSPSFKLDGLRIEPITVASASVDGDLYGLMPYSSNSIDILIGDVMGKGIAAALLGAGLKSAFLKASLHLLVEKNGRLPKPDALVSAVHDTVAEELSSLQSFATAQYARVDSRNARMDFVDCGHTAIIHYDASLDSVWFLKGSDLPLGFSDESAYSRYAVPISEGDRLVFYSDGITEAPGADGELFGEGRLASIVCANASLDPAELSRRIVTTALYFTAEARFRDDVTCIALSVDRIARPPRRDFRKFDPSIHSVGGIRAFVGEFFAGEVEEMASRALLAVSEAATNVIRHGLASCGDDDGSPSLFCEPCLPDEDGLMPDESDSSPADSRLRVDCLRAAEWLSVRIVYEGRAFAWHLPAEVPDIEDMPEGGFGRSLMETSADSVLYASGPNALNMVCLFFETATGAGL